MRWAVRLPCLEAAWPAPSAVALGMIGALVIGVTSTRPIEAVWPAVRGPSGY